MPKRDKLSGEHLIGRDEQAAHKIPTAQDALDAIASRDGATLSRYLFAFPRKCDPAVIMALAELFNPSNTPLASDYRLEFLPRGKAGRPQMAAINGALMSLRYDELKAEAEGAGKKVLGKKIIGQIATEMGMSDAYVSDRLKAHKSFNRANPRLVRSDDWNAVEKARQDRLKKGG